MTTCGPGSLAIAKHDKLVYARAFTWAEQGYPVTRPENIFRVGSNSKQFVKLLVLQLAEKGVLSLDDKYIDRVKLTTPVSEMGNKIPQMTIRQMLEHKAGLPPSGGDWDSLSQEDQREVASEPKETIPIIVS
jgi:CubicO group peptidase (beta-lactamase class C family)